MRYSLKELFSILDNNSAVNGQEDLFGFTDNNIAEKNTINKKVSNNCVPDSFELEYIPSIPPRYSSEDLDFIFSYFNKGFNKSILYKQALVLLELSPEAFDNFIHAWMSELAVEKEISAFGRMIAGIAKNSGSLKEKKHAAKKALYDRGNDDTRIVLNASGKVYREIHRMVGLLRFNPVNDIFIARFSPDHFIIPALGGYFTSRFGRTKWLIADEKRSLCLSSLESKGGVSLTYFDGNLADVQNKRTDDEWEKLWQHYHKIINNESRNNAGLQRQFMPKRYWKYLPETD